MNDLETTLQQKLSLATSENTNTLRARVLAEVGQELRSRRRDRLAIRLVFSGLLLGIVGNVAVKHQEGTRTAHWFPHESSSSAEFLVEAEQPNPTPSPFEDYLLAFYLSPQSPWGNSRAARSDQARAMAAWIDEFAEPGQFRNR